MPTLDMNNNSSAISRNYEPREKPVEFPNYQADVEKATTATRSRLIQQNVWEDTNTTNSQSIKPTLKNNFMTENKENTTNDKPLIRPSKDVEDVSKMLKAPLSITKEQLEDRQNCFEMFRRSYRKYDAINDNMEILKKLYDKGQKLSSVVKQSRVNVEKYKNKIEDIRKQQAVMGIMNCDDK